MRHAPSPLTLLALSLALAAPDTRAGATTAPLTMAEIVTFRLTPGTDPVAFLVAARATEGPVSAQPGFIRRSLSRDEAGLWTDYVEWADLPSALSAAEVVMTLPEFGPFMAAIDPQSVQMRHAPVLWQMGD
jgi:hypothetical protein